MNVYQYCGNDPVNYTDPFGLWGVWFGDTHLGDDNPWMVFDQNSWFDLEKGAYATIDGIIPFADPFENRYVSNGKCGSKTVDEEFEWSKRFGAWGRDFLLFAATNPSIPLKINVTGVSEPTHVGLDMWGRNIFHYGRHVQWGRHVGIGFKGRGAWLHIYKGRWFIPK